MIDQVIDWATSSKLHLFAFPLEIVLIPFGCVLRVVILLEDPAHRLLFVLFVLFFALLILNA